MAAGRARTVGAATMPLVIALVAAAVLAGIGLWLRVSVAVPDRPALPVRLMPVLFSAAGLCVAALTATRLPAVAWLSTAGAAAIATVEIVAVARTAQPVVDASTGTTLLVLGAAALVTGVSIAAAYAAHRRDPTSAVRARTIAAFGVAAVLASAAVAVWAIGAGPAAAALGTADPASLPIRVAARLSLAIVGVGIAAGLVRDFAGPMRRAVTRYRARPALPTGARPSFLVILAEEVLPARSWEGRRAAEAERARIAADLHAFVLPELRQAAAAAGASDAAGPVAAGLRRSLDGVEQLMAERQSIVLDEFGLVAALEWLAERTEERSTLRVELELDGDRVADRSAVPLDVGRVLFRIALLALDNVVRHAAATVATVRLDVRSDGLRLAIRDDGAGERGAARSQPGRGLVDMRAAAEAVGAHVSFSTGADGGLVDVAWSATRDPKRTDATTGPGSVGGLP